MVGFRKIQGHTYPVLIILNDQLLNKRLSARPRTLVESLRFFRDRPNQSRFDLSFYLLTCKLLIQVGGHLPSS